MWRVFTATTIMAMACVPALAGGIWVKGNTHCHTNNSDGDSTLQVVADWYRSHGYGFVFITDHNKVTELSAYSVPGDFLLIPGEEVSAGFGGKPVHLCGLGLSSVVSPITGKSIADTLQQNVDAIAGAEAIPQINHPNWHYAFDHRELQEVTGCSLLEIYNASSGCNNPGDAAHLSVEQIWDVLLSEGKRFYAIASDDAHCYTTFDPSRDNPGTGWIVARVGKLTREDVMEALRKGDFYASTGVELADYAADGSSIRISVKPTEGKAYRIRFIGLHGKILREVDGVRAEYGLTGDSSERYVRAKVICSDGTVAWTQPVWR